MNWLYSFLPENFVHALGWTVLHSFWQGIAIAAIMALLMTQIQNRSAAMRYRIAYGSLLALCGSSVVTFIYFIQKKSPTHEELQIIAQILRGDSAAFVAVSEGDYWSITTLFLQKNLPFITLVWLMGVAFFTLRLMSGLLYVQQLKTRHIAALSSDWQARAYAFKNRLGIDKIVDIAESALVSVPMVIGWLKPMILLPIGAVNQLNPAQIEAIIAHELAHVAGRDYLLNIVQSIIEIMFYYHPAAWWISANIRVERENRCDDVAVQLCGSSLTYAKALLSIQEMQLSQVRTYGLAMTFAGRRKNLLLKRIKRILNQPHNRTNIMEKLIATGLLLAVVSVLSFGGNKFSQQKSEKTDKNTPSVSEAISTDSLPKKGKVWVKKEDKYGKQVEIQVTNGEIQSLKIDGKDVSKDEYDTYRDLVETLVVPPVPPLPPTFPTLPTPPSAPSFPTPPSPPTPPTAPFHFYYNDDYSSMRSGKDAEGNTILKLNKGDGKLSVIKITPSKEVFIDGKKMEEGKDYKLNRDHDNGKFSFDWNRDLAEELRWVKKLKFNLDDDEFKDLKKLKELKGLVDMNGFGFPNGSGAHGFYFNDSLLNKAWGKGTFVIDGDHIFRLGGDFSSPRFSIHPNFKSYHFDNNGSYSFGDSEESRKMAETMRKQSEEMRRNGEKLREESLKNAEKMRELSQRQREEANAFKRDLQAKERELQSKLRELAAEQRAITAKQREEFAKVREKMATERGERNKQFRADLEADGLIEKGTKRIEVELDDDRLRVNGKKASPEQHQKYLKKYCKDCKGDFKWRFTDDGER